jgi:alpha-L-fucosidase 2
MLLQSHLGEVQLLPALPDKWQTGSVKALVARGGFVVNMYWQKGKLTKAVITSKNGGTCKLRTNVPVQVKRVQANYTQDSAYTPAAYLTSFDTKAGTTYAIDLR